MEISYKAVPPDIFKIIQDEQAKEKKNRGTNQYSLSKVLSKIIREWANNCRKSQQS